MQTLTATAMADVNGDGDVTPDDAFIIQQVDAKIIDRMDLPYTK